MTVNAKVNNTNSDRHLLADQYTRRYRARSPCRAGSNSIHRREHDLRSTLQAKVLDTLGNPVSGVTVTFTVPTTGTSGFFAGATTVTAATNAGHRHESAIKANTVSGTFFAQATITGVPTPAIYTLTNTPALAGCDFDCLGNNAIGDRRNCIRRAPGRPGQRRLRQPRAGRFHQFPCADGWFGRSVPQASNSATVTTDANGKATSPILTANSIAGTYKASVSIATASRS